jgi:hypothetical protein
MAKKEKRTVASFFAQTGWQVAIAFALFLAALVRAHQIHRAGASLPDPRQATYVLASIGAVLGLATSVAFGFVVFIVNQANSRKHDLYFRFKTGLFEFDKFLKEYPEKIILVGKCLELSWRLKSLRITDFPILDWEERLYEATEALEELDENFGGDPNLSNKVLGFLVYLEDIVSEIGILCIRQILAGLHVGTVIKAFVTLGFLLLSLVLSYLFSGSIASAIIGALPVLFATMAALILFEIGWYLYREADELLDFVQKDSDCNGA